MYIRYVYVLFVIITNIDVIRLKDKREKGGERPNLVLLKKGLRAELFCNIKVR